MLRNIFLPSLLISNWLQVTFLGLSQTFTMTNVSFADSYDVNVSPDKRSIFLHSEQNLIEALKVRVLLTRLRIT